MTFLSGFMALSIACGPLDIAGRAAGRVEQRQRWRTIVIWCSWLGGNRLGWHCRRRRPGKRDPLAVIGVL